MARRSFIRGTGSYLPEKVLTNEDLSKMVETTDDWIVERTGIRRRHIAADGEVTSDIAAAAAKRALEAAGLQASGWAQRHDSDATARRLLRPARPCALASLRRRRAVQVDRRALPHARGRPRCVPRAQGEPHPMHDLVRRHLCSARRSAADRRATAHHEHRGRRLVPRSRHVH